MGNKYDVRHFRTKQWKFEGDHSELKDSKIHSINAGCPHLLTARPGRPCNPLCPFKPGRPLGPLSPGSPLSPLIPWGPCEEKEGQIGRLPSLKNDTHFSTNIA